MTHLRVASLFVACASWVLSAHQSRAQITVSGVTTRSIVADSVTFTVVTEPGYNYDARLNGVPVPVGVAYTTNFADYYELLVFRTNTSTLEVTNRLVQFILRSSARSNSEDGIPSWTPYPLINSASNEFVGAALRVIAPSQFPAGLEIPVVAWVVNDAGHAVRANGWLNAEGHPAIRVRRGVGSGFLAATNAPGLLNYAPQIAGLTTNKSITIESTPTWTLIAGTLSGAVTWPENSRIGITGHVVIANNATLTIGAGSVVRISPGVDITNNGVVTVNGTLEQPVVFTPVSRAQPWGGFIMRNGLGQIQATGAIFTGSGAVPNWFGSSGNPGSHRPEQALFFCNGTNVVTMTDCASIYLAGQLGHAVNGGTFTFTRFLMQRTTTGGEYSGSSAPLVFRVNDSAFIECPDDSPNFVDGDNDALYLVHGTHGFTNTLIGWTKDDGIDSGGDGAARLTYQNCWFESIFHEGNSLSGRQTASPHADKDVRHIEGVFIGCGQGLEDGYGGPTGRLDRCLVTLGMTGARFGDNYPWQYFGLLQVTNSILIHNYRDVWGFNQQDWAYRASAMEVQDNWLTLPNAFHPNNLTWDPALDRDLLTNFMTIPFDSAVGVALAIRQRQYDLDALTNGVAIGLSSFTPEYVSVDYTVESPMELLEQGTVIFEPGETVKRLWPQVNDLASRSLVRVALQAPAQAELTGLSRVYFVRPSSTATNPFTTLIATGSVWKYLDTGDDAGTTWRELGYNPDGWLEGRGELGYGDTPRDETTLVRSNGVSGRIITTYFRHEFEVTDPAAYGELELLVKRDDGVVVYLNNSEVWRSTNLPAPPTAITFTTLADQGPTAENTIEIITLGTGLLRTGTNLVAAEIHQERATSSDISFELRLRAQPPLLRPELTLAAFSDEQVLTWSGAGVVLEEAETVNGPWHEVPQGASPFALPLTGAQRFYRLKRP